MNRHARRGLGMAALLLGSAATWALELNFSVSLDGKPIGEHRFSITGEAGARQVRSDARFDIKLLGLTVYRYRHEASEQWQGDCLVDLRAATDDDGKPSRVQAQARGDGFEVVAGGATQTLPGCVMSFAYWSPAIRPQSHLLNAQTGRHEPVRMQRAGRAPIEVRGAPLEAERCRIEGPEQPVDVWYLPGGEWVGLDSTVGGGRKLSYRLR